MMVSTIINGQKTWSTRQYGPIGRSACLELTLNLSGIVVLSFILVPLDLEGITVRPIPQLDGLPGFAEIFFDNVKVPVDCLLGEEGKGWSVAMATAGFERGLIFAFASTLSADG